MIDSSKPYLTREGRAARILCVDHEDPLYPVVAAVKLKAEDTFSMVFLYTAEGRYAFGDKGQHKHDLMLGAA